MNKSESETKEEAMKSEVKYETPVGGFGTWEEAMRACERCDLDPVLCIKYIEEKDRR